VVEDLEQIREWLFKASDIFLPSLVLTCIPHSLQASAEEIKRAWKKQALLHHPDRLITVTEEAKQRFLNIQHAYEVLRDSMLRAEYDKELLHRLYLEVSAVFYCGNRRSPSCLSPPSVVANKTHRLKLLPFNFCRNIFVALLT